jgi:LCP family protein required for cell wall assembly
MQCVSSALMSQDPEESARKRDSEYRVYRSGQSGAVADRRRRQKSAQRPPRPPSGGAGGGGGQRPYTLYRSAPRGLIARLRGESDYEIAQREEARLRTPRPVRLATGPWWRRRWTVRRGLLTVLGLVVGWVLLSAVLFLVSAQTRAGDLPAGASSQLTSGGPMLTSANTVLILGLDNRPRTGAGSKEGGLQSYDFSEADANTDTIMLWRIGGGVSRRLSIPRDTLVNVPGYGDEKINAAWSQGGPRLALQVIKQFTGLKINHLIVVDLANFPKFINDVGGVTVKTGRICSQISGGAQDGGFTLNLSPGVHHLNGLQALILARTRENSCNVGYSDIQRELAQQEILNGIRSQLLTVHTFLHLPWAAWDAPGVLQTDMGGLSLLQLFVASEIGGSAAPNKLTETNSSYGGESVLIPNEANVQSQVAKLMNG